MPLNTTRRALLIGAPIAAAGAWMLSARGGALPPLAASAQGAVDTSGIAEMAMGAEDAPVTLTEYASFTCPHCKTWHDEIMPGIKADYVDTGRVRFVYREVYFDRYGLWAAMLARCGGPERYFGIVDLLYGEQAEWARGEPAQVAENLRRIGLKAGLDQAQIEACMADGETAQALVTLYEERAAADGINSTPSFLIGDEKLPNLSEADLRAALDAALAG